MVMNMKCMDENERCDKHCPENERPSSYGPAKPEMGLPRPLTDMMKTDENEVL